MLRQYPQDAAVPGAVICPLSLDLFDESLFSAFRHSLALSLTRVFAPTLQMHTLAREPGRKDTLEASDTPAR